MANVLCKIYDPVQQKDLYFVWSTVVDAPITIGMNKEVFYKQYQNKPDRLECLESNGTSALDYNSVYKLITLNRAGKGETQLTIDELLEYLRTGRIPKVENKYVVFDHKNHCFINPDLSTISYHKIQPTIIDTHYYPLQIFESHHDALKTQCNYDNLTHTELFSIRGDSRYKFII